MRQSVSVVVVALGFAAALQGCASVRPVNVETSHAAPSMGGSSKSAMTETVSDDEIKKAFMATLAGMRAEFAGVQPAPAPDPGDAPLPGMSPITERNIPAETQVASASGSIPVFSPTDIPSADIEVKGDSIVGATSAATNLALAPVASEVPVVSEIAPVPAEPRKSLPSAKTLEAAMKKTGYTVSFGDDESRIYSATSLDIEYSNAEELAKEIEARTNLFCSAVDGAIMVSMLKERTYSISPFEKVMAKNVGDLLSNPKAEARIIDGAGQMVVTDDRIGHQKVNDVLEQMKAETFASYRFKIEVEKKGAFSKGTMELASSGEVTPATSPISVGDWMIGVRKQGERLFVEVLNAKTMDNPATFVMDGERGGNANFQANQDGKEQHVAISVTK